MWAWISQDTVLGAKRLLWGFLATSTSSHSAGLASAPSPPCGGTAGKQSGKQHLTYSGKYVSEERRYLILIKERRSLILISFSNIPLGVWSSGRFGVRDKEEKWIKAYLQSGFKEIVKSVFSCSVPICSEAFTGELRMNPLRSLVPKCASVSARFRLQTYILVERVVFIPFIMFWDKVVHLLRGTVGGWCILREQWVQCLLDPLDLD